MNEVTTIGLDLAKNVFQVHGVDASGRAVVRRQLRRSQVLPFFEKQAACLVGIEACATSHHWAREIAKFGHEVRLMPARGFVTLSAFSCGECSGQLASCGGGCPGPSAE